MSRDHTVTPLRPVLLWLSVTAASAGMARLAAGPVLAPLPQTPSAAPFADLLVRLCALCLLVAVAHLWLVTTLTVVDVLRGVVRPVSGSATRRLVLLACGAALAAGTAAPAGAADGDAGLAGLRLPDRAVSAPVAASPGAERPSPAAHTALTAEAFHLVREGESLWSIAAGSFPAGARVTTDELDERWRGIWAANRAVVGPDPDLIVPGQLLRLPPFDAVRTDSTSTDTTTRPGSSQEQGDRP